VRRRTRKKLREVLLFLFKFNLLAIPLYILLYLDFSFQPLQDFVAFLSFKLLSMLGIQASVNESLITVISGFKLSIIDISMDCTGWKSLYALFALAVATPGIKIARKRNFLLLTLPLLFLLNILRIVITVYLSLFLEPAIFGLVHDIFWQWGLTIAILGMWVFWLKYEKVI
jgi:exosortase/archaeosortase family protein